MKDSPLSVIYERISACDFCSRIVAWSHAASRANPHAMQLKGAPGSLPAFIAHHLARKTRRPVACILPDAEAAAYLHSDLEQLTSSVLLFPPSGQNPYDQERIADSMPLVRRADVLHQLGENFTGITVTSVEALCERVPARSVAQEETRTLQVGEETPPLQLIESMLAQGFERVEFVEQPGELAWRGGIVDVFAFVGDYPIRIEFYGDLIESLREFDARSQRSVSSLESARITPCLDLLPEADGGYASLLDYLHADTILALTDGGRFVAEADAHLERAQKLYAQLEAEEEAAAPHQRFMESDALLRRLREFPRLLFGAFPDAIAPSEIVVAASGQPAFNGHMDLLRAQLSTNARRGMDTLMLCDSKGQKERLFDLLEDVVEESRVTLFVESLHEGFELPQAQFALYTDHQIFNRYHRPSARKRQGRRGIRLRELRTLQPGDFVVHSDYGIGTFAGLKKITVRDKIQEAVRILYADDDVLYVNVHALHKLHKYAGKDGQAPRLTKLGSGRWERSKNRTKSRIKDIARDLILLYARRKSSQGHSFELDSIWQRELEASFAFEDTPDQFSASEAVKRDMEASAPMDRLICGDVGFGKTEVAVRAAFKAAQEGKQVAVLVPTTVLARQHYETFRKRLDQFPVRIEMLSRFRSGPELKSAIEHLGKGAVDIAVGTHRLVSKDVRFKDLGLLIIDEEQRFGVGVKERLRQMRVNVDTLTLTATPIPRTLQFSLMGARDLSIINTPPPNRQPILTEIHSFNKNLVRDAILYETSRGGQVFFVHNRVHSIKDFSTMLRDLVPGVRMEEAHGRMSAARLERVMTRFVDGDCDMLVSTTIIENGLDIANANTIIIHQAQRFGLAELHQLRGRVGRSDRKAFCYLLVPSIHTLSREARRRLQAVEELSDLGSGLQIAMRDLDIRGAGNVLGGEQSGFIQELGYETYHHMLDEAVQELRTEEFPGQVATAPPIDTVVDAAIDASIPESYVASRFERLALYRRISEIRSTAELSELRAEIIDRFGPVPQEADNLLQVADIKLCAQLLRLPRVQLRNQRLFLRIPSELADPHFFEHIFQPLLKGLHNLSRRYVLKESKQQKLRAIVQNVDSLEDALSVLGELLPKDVPA